MRAMNELESLRKKLTKKVKNWRVDNTHDGMKLVWGGDWKKLKNPGNVLEYEKRVLCIIFV